MNFLSLPLAFELELRIVILKTLELESELIILSLQGASLISFLFNLLSIFDEEFIFIDLELITLPSQLKEFLLALGNSPATLFTVSSELSNEISFSRSIFYSQL